MDNIRTGEIHWKPIYKTGAIAALIFLLYSLITMIQMFTLGGPPANAEEIFAMLQENRLLGLMRLDGLTLLVLPLYYLIYLGFFVALRNQNKAYAFLGAALLMAGLTMVLATPTAFSLASLSDKYLAAASAAEQERFLSAGEALLAANMWQGSGAMLGRLLMLIAGLIGSAMMLKSPAFSRFTAYTGLGAHGFDLIHGIGVFLAWQGGYMLMAIAGTLYLFWFPLLAWNLFKLAKTPN
ncbi:MAG: hypothetical protein WEA61_07520 [Anaerolineales bacterium]